MLQRRVLAAALAVILSLHTAEAKAGVLDDLVKAYLIIVVVGGLVVGTTEVLTVAASYKNTRTATQHAEPSAGWIGVGVVGGLANLGLGGYLFADSLPSTSTGPCDTGRDPPYLPPAPGSPGQCLHHTPASTGGLIAGAIFMGVGAFALGSVGWAIKNAPDGSARSATPGTAPAAIGLSLPLLRF